MFNKIMKNIQSNSSFFNSVLIGICVFCVLLALIMFNNMKSAGRAIKDKNVALIRERAELKIQFDSLNEAFEKNKVTTSSLESEKKSIAEEFARLEKEYAESKTRKTKTLDALKHENKYMRRKIDLFRKLSTTELIKQITSRETNDSIKRILTDTLVKIEMTKDGKLIELEPIVLPAGDNQPYANNGISKKQGEIISLNKKNSLIVINMGRAQGVTDGQRCRIIDNRGEIASGMIIRTRYEISAAFIDTFSKSYTIENVKEDAKVILD